LVLILTLWAQPWWHRTQRMAARPGLERLVGPSSSPTLREALVRSRWRRLDTSRDAATAEPIDLTGSSNAIRAIGARPQFSSG
jgi:hypothetical protein